MILKNYTPHKIVVYDEEGKEIKATYPSMGIARVEEDNIEGLDINDIPVVRKQYTKLIGLPDPQRGVTYIVSLVVLNFSQREDLVAPDTGPDSVVRVPDGSYVGGIRRFTKKSEFELFNYGNLNIEKYPFSLFHRGIIMGEFRSIGKLIEVYIKDELRYHKLDDSFPCKSCDKTKEYYKLIEKEMDSFIDYFKHYFIEGDIELPQYIEDSKDLCNYFIKCVEGYLQVEIHGEEYFYCKQKLKEIWDDIQKKKNRLKIGFTGTRKGMTDYQKMKIFDYLRNLDSTGFILHHGDCIGADEEVHEIAKFMKADIIIHPGPDKIWRNDKKVRAYCAGGKRVEPVKPFLERNRNIVDSCDILIAAPEGEEKRRSGTWSTIRYAKKQGKGIIIFNREK